MTLVDVEIDKSEVTLTLSMAHLRYQRHRDSGVRKIFANPGHIDTNSSEPESR